MNKKINNSFIKLFKTLEEISVKHFKIVNNILKNNGKIE